MIYLKGVGRNTTVSSKKFTFGFPKQLKISDFLFFALIMNSRVKHNSTCKD